ncbi:MAG: hypothetical protein AB1782_07505 [Cyanobacteriota bacterium]
MNVDISSKKISTPMDIGTILSRTWRLYRLNFYKIIPFSIIPTVIAWIILIFITSIKNTIYSSNHIYNSCFITPANCIFSLGIIFLALFSNYAISQAFYKIFFQDNSNISDISKELLINKRRILDLGGLFIFEIAAIGVFDVLLFVLIAFFMGAISVIFQGTISICNSIMIVLISICVLLLLLFQFYFFILQNIFIALDNIKVLEVFKTIFRFLSRSAMRFILFGFCLVSIWFSMLITFNLPFSLTILLLERFAGLSKDSLTSLLIYKFGEGLSATIAWPFIIGSITIFIIDCKIRYEGIDLLKAIKQERHLLNTV